jgi:DNA-binding transcriptional LysR family regulator
VINFNHLYYFHVTASEGSVKAAADRLGVTQPTVSEQIRMLERAFERAAVRLHPSGLKLTQSGRDAYEHTTTMFWPLTRLCCAAMPRLAGAGGCERGDVPHGGGRLPDATLEVEHCRPSIDRRQQRSMRDLRAHEPTSSWRERAAARRSPRVRGRHHPQTRARRDRGPDAERPSDCRTSRCSSTARPPGTTGRPYFEEMARADGRSRFDDAF